MGDRCRWAGTSKAGPAILRMDPDAPPLCVGHTNGDPRTHPRVLGLAAPGRRDGLAFLPGFRGALDSCAESWPRVLPQTCPRKAAPHANRLPEPGHWDMLRRDQRRWTHTRPKAQWSLELLPTVDANRNPGVPPLAFLSAQSYWRKKRAWVL